MLQALKGSRTDFSFLKTFRSGGGTVPLELIVTFKVATGIEITESYDSTECEECCMNPLMGERKDARPDSACLCGDR